MYRYHILVLTTDELSSVRSSNQERLTNVEVIEATTPSTLRNALTQCEYDLVCIQFPLSWSSLHDAIQIVRDELPTCPLIPFTRKDMTQFTNLLVDIAYVGLDRTG